MKGEIIGVWKETERREGMLGRNREAERNAHAGLAVRWQATAVPPARWPMCAVFRKTFH